MLVDKNAATKQACGARTRNLLGQLQTHYCGPTCSIKNTQTHAAYDTYLGSDSHVLCRHLEGTVSTIIAREGATVSCDCNCGACLLADVDCARVEWAIIDRSEKSARPMFTLDDQ